MTAMWRFRVYEADAAIVAAARIWVRAESGLLDGVAEIGSGTVAQRMWAKAGYHGHRHRHHTPIAQASNTLIPRASAKVRSAGLPGGDAAGHLDARRHLEQNAPWGAQVTVTPGDVGQPTRSTPVAWSMRAAHAPSGKPGGRTCSYGSGWVHPVHPRIRRGVPPDATILVTGVEDPGTQAHSVKREPASGGTLERAACTGLCCWRLRGGRSSRSVEEVGFPRPSESHHRRRRCARGCNGFASALPRSSIPGGAFPLAGR